MKKKYPGMTVYNILRKFQHYRERTEEEQKEEAKNTQEQKVSKEEEAKKKQGTGSEVKEETANAQGTRTESAEQKEKKYKRVCEYIDIFASRIMKRTTFLKLSAQAVCELLKRDTINAKESEVGPVFCKSIDFFYRFFFVPRFRICFWFRAHIQTHIVFAGCSTGVH